MRHTEHMCVLLAQPWHVMCPLWHWRTTLSTGTVRQTGHCRISVIFALKLVSLASASSILRFMDSNSCCNIEWGYELWVSWDGWHTITFMRKWQLLKYVWEENEIYHCDGRFLSHADDRCAIMIEGPLNREFPSPGPTGIFYQNGYFNKGTY